MLEVRSWMKDVRCYKCSIASLVLIVSHSPHLEQLQHFEHCYYIIFCDGLGNICNFCLDRVE